VCSRGRPFRARLARLGVIALIETPEGVEDIESIAAVPGLLAVLAGPFDLSVTMGLQGDTLHPKVSDALNRVVEVTLANKVPLVMPIFEAAASDTRAQMAHWLLEGGATVYRGHGQAAVRRSLRTLRAGVARP